MKTPPPTNPNNPHNQPLPPGFLDPEKNLAGNPPDEKPPGKKPKPTLKKDPATTAKMEKPPVSGQAQNVAVNVAATTPAAAKKAKPAAKSRDVGTIRLEGAAKVEVVVTQPPPPAPPATAKKVWWPVAATIMGVLLLAAGCSCCYSFSKNHDLQKQIVNLQQANTPAPAPAAQAPATQTSNTPAPAIPAPVVRAQTAPHQPAPAPARVPKMDPAIAKALDTANDRAGTDAIIKMWFGTPAVIKAVSEANSKSHAPTAEAGGASDLQNRVAALETKIALARADELMGNNDPRVFAPRRANINKMVRDLESLKNHLKELAH